MVDWVVVLIAAVLGALPGVYAIISGRHKVKAEAARIVSDTAVGLLKPLQARIDRLETMVVKLEEKVQQLESDNDELSRQVREFRALIRSLWEGVLILSQQLESQGITPAWDQKQYQKAVEKVLGDIRE